MRYGARRLLKLHTPSVLNYFNPVGGGQTLGSMFIWTRAGRPEVAGAIWSKQSGEQRRVVHSFHSLSRQPLSAVRNGMTFWFPFQSGIEPIVVPSASAPAANSAQRLLQMRG
jgi:hypothetical protein